MLPSLIRALVWALTGRRELDCCRMLSGEGHASGGDQVTSVLWDAQGEAHAVATLIAAASRPASAAVTSGSVSPIL
jgi:hypothetical protein